MLSQDDDDAMTHLIRKQTDKRKWCQGVSIGFYNIIKTCAQSQLTAKPIQLVIQVLHNLVVSNNGRSWTQWVERWFCQGLKVMEYIRIEFVTFIRYHRITNPCIKNWIVDFAWGFPNITFCKWYWFCTLWLCVLCK